MFAIGFHDSEFLFYEGQIGFGRAIWPSPVLSVATLIGNREDFQRIPETHNLATKSVFREDSYDPVTRVRRGRLYEWAPGFAQPHAWMVQPHPAYRDELTRGVHAGGPLRKFLYCWQAYPAFQKLGRHSGQTTIALGSRDAYTLWRVVDIERIVTGEDLLTLRARSYLGVLPEIRPEAIPSDGRAKVVELVEKLVDGAHRSEAESVVDLARATAQWCLGVWLAEETNNPKMKLADLGELARVLEDNRLKSVAQILARLHSRTKPNEQARYETRHVTNDDAEFAVASISMLLRELGWAR